MQIENEGLVFALIVFVLGGLLRPRQVLKAIASPLIVAALSPVLLWTFYRFYFGIENDLAGNFDIQRVVLRLGSWNLFWKDFLHYFFFKTDILWTLVVSLLVFAGLWWRRKIQWDCAVWISLGAYLGYCLVLLAVYLSTHWVLWGHLNSSVMRVAFMPALVLLGAVLLALPSRIESRQE